MMKDIATIISQNFAKLYYNFVLPMQIQESLQVSRPKADLAFFNAFMSLTNERYFSVCINFLKALQFAILVPANILKFEASSDLIECLIYNLAASLLGMTFSLVSIVFIFRQVTVFLNVADQTKHTIAQQLTTNFSEIQQCKSESIYVADSNLRLEDINDDNKKLYDQIAKNAIVSTLKARYVWYRNGENLYSLISFSTMVYSIIILSTANMNGATEANLIIYVIIVGLSQFLVLLGLLLLTLAPLICVGICIFCCFCRSNPNGNANYINIPMKDAAQSDIINAGGSCSICYQDISVNDKIYVLLCSDKHVFHSDCLKSWTRVKNTCPNCRQQIPMIDHELINSASQNSQIRQQ